MKAQQDEYKCHMLFRFHELRYFTNEISAALDRITV
jgi:hypothetical protein